ncbi:hypothetical protein A0J57_16840 [Sphingobium sp. 22B]|nr:hypothetical protein AXW74_12250 [Sphingobium sp. AM]KYC31112.1 hypothetical protein A0J57_16840 [Sphingobium sp. 22B]OAP31114.1 hypothetical protein A8O16_14745 [Sphingobium sp. 20006FA]
MTGIRHNDVGVEMKVRDISDILFKQGSVAIDPEWALIVDHIGSHEFAKLVPGTGIKACNILLIHADCRCFL